MLGSLRMAHAVAAFMLVLTIGAPSVKAVAPYDVIVPDYNHNAIYRFAGDTGAQITGSPWSPPVIPHPWGSTVDQKSYQVYVGRFDGTSVSEIYRLNRNGS